MSIYIVALCALIIANLHIYRDVLVQRTLEVHVLHAGKGSVVLVRTPGGALLVDAGTDASILRAVGESLPMWQRNIDAVVLTDSGSLSTGGLRALEERYQLSDIARFGTTIPYGADVAFEGNTYIRVPGPQKVIISYGASVLSVSSTTPAGEYRLDGVR